MRDFIKEVFDICCFTFILAAVVTIVAFEPFTIVIFSPLIVAVVLQQAQEAEKWKDDVL